MLTAELKDTLGLRLFGFDVIVEEHSGAVDAVRHVVHTLAWLETCHSMYMPCMLWHGVALLLNCRPNFAAVI